VHLRSLRCALVKGAIAAGHRKTAEAGARTLSEGGNAVDACVAAAFASWVVESPLTGPGSGGFMLVHTPRDRTTRVLDFFVDIPGRGTRRPRVAEMEEIDVEFAESSQSFRIGAASCAVPGAPAGLERAHDAYGALPWRTLVEPAVELAHEGVELTRPQAHLHAMLDLILRHSDEGRRLYGRDGRRLVAGEKLILSDLGDTLEQVGRNGAHELYEGEVAHEIVRHVRDEGGALTLDDLRSYRVIRRRPVRARLFGHEFESNPPPSTGGVLIAYGLRLVDGLGRAGPPGSAESMAQLVEIMREQDRARGGRFGRDLYRGGLAARLHADAAVTSALERIRGTTHISVVDEHGSAASLTASTGSGSGVIVPGTGIHLNNMLGEFDLAGAGTTGRPGTRMTSMMAPSLVLHDGHPRLVVGSAGSRRLRGAIMQIVVNSIVHELPVEEAIARPRVHFDDSYVHCEGGADPAELDRLEAMGYDLIRWRRRNLFFGGAAAVEMLPDGSVAAAGDPRRGGAGIVVR
jgi:gamma-glutamyltranspeptidase / glutathione hydrolase